uniref:Gustatory receptor n=1 Tax=Phlebotomus papatasi TaxID=29031 RepID=A0A1B0D991_PHLPP
MFPLNGIASNLPDKILFSWKSVRTAYSLVYAAFGFFMLFFFTKHIISIGITAKNLVGTVFLSISTISYFYFIWLAGKWRKIMIFWMYKERPFLKYPYQVNRIPVVVHVRLLGSILLILSLIEHALFLINSVYSAFKEASVCKYDLPDRAKYYFLKQFPSVFNEIPYSLFLGLILTYINFCLTFAWNFLDVFAILISIGLAKRFEQINKRLTLVKGKYLPPESYWQQVRHHYVKLCELVEFVEIYVSPLVLVCCASDLYFICYQLLNIFNILPYTTSQIYFWYSLIYLILRSLCLLLCTSEINDQSKRPLLILKTIPTYAWCVELDRFIHQTSKETICLTGMRFFFFTRKLVLSMIGTVVTYELVLMQFDLNKNEVDTHENEIVFRYDCNFTY